MTVSAETDPPKNPKTPEPQRRVGLSGQLLSAFPAFESTNFRRYFPGQVISMIGTWIQMVAQGWLVLEITGSAFDVGLAAAASTLPPLFLSLLGGVIVDRYPRRTILLWTSLRPCCLPLCLAFLPSPAR